MVFLGTPGNPEPKALLFPRRFPKKHNLNGAKTPLVGKFTQGFWPPECVLAPGPSGLLFLAVCPVGAVYSQMVGARPGGPRKFWRGP